MEYWNDDFKGFFINFNYLFPLLFPIFQHSNIPLLHTGGMNRISLEN